MRFILEFYNRFEYIFSFFIPIITFIIGYIISRWRKYKSSKRIKDVLSLKKANSIIILPVWEGKEIVDSTKPPRDCIIYEESFILYEIKTTINYIFKNNFHANFEGIVNESTLLKPSSNHFYFGGYKPHVNVYNMLKQYCSNVKFSCDYKEYENNKHKAILYPYKHDGDVRHIKIDKLTFTYDCVKEGYVILIKLTGEILENDERGTVHICFGNSAISTRASAQCFNNHRIEFHKRLKKRKSCYFAIMKCHTNGEIDFPSFRDFTDEVFGN